MALPQRRLPVGAEILPSGEAHFRVWAPRRRAVEVVLEGGGAHRAEPRRAAATSRARCAEARAGALLPLPPRRRRAASPTPPRASSPKARTARRRSSTPPPSAGRDDDWQGVALRGQVIYEMHVGTFTPEGTWDGGRARAARPGATLGITVLEVMPVAEFPGRFGWGYDGVDLFAPDAPLRHARRLPPLRRPAHALGLGVILDVVYNHLGPDGNYLPQFSERYFTDRYENEWGEAINFDGDGQRARCASSSSPTPATGSTSSTSTACASTPRSSIFDASPEHILAAIGRAARARRPRPRAILLVAENEPQDDAAGPAAGARAATASTRSGTTTSTTARWSP